MKQQLLLLGFFGLTTYLAQAQTEKGVSWFTGGISAQSRVNDLFQDVNRVNTLNISFAQGTFLAPNVLVGADLRLSRVRDITREGFNFDAVSDVRQTAFTATPFVRRFWGKQALRGYVGGGIAVRYGRDRQLTSNTRTYTAETETNTWRVRPDLQAGLFYAINYQWGVDLTARSSIAPIVFTDLGLSLVVMTGVKPGTVAKPTKKTPTQLLTGNWVVGGTFDLGGERRLLTGRSETSTSQQEQQTQQYRVSPSVGLFVSKGWLVGVAVPISRQTQTSDFLRASRVSAQSTSTNQSVITTDAIGVSPYVKRYFSKAKFGPFATAQVGWQRERTYGVRTTPETNTTAYSWRIGGGLAYLLGNRFIVEGEVAGVGGEWLDMQQTGESRTRFDVSASLRPAFTLSYVFL